MEKRRKEHSLAEEDRREFLKACGRFAAVTPPAVTLLLSTSLTTEAIAKSGSGGGSIVRNVEGGRKGGKGTNGGKGSFKPGH
ncbi:hypothetical protein GOB24_22030 [Sinorhizobium meliloti]|nr:hypothetical protein [Sinorhizobium meliloti]